MIGAFAILRKIILQPRTVSLIILAMPIPAIPHRAALALVLTSLLAGCVLPPTYSERRIVRPPTAQAATTQEPMYFYPERGQSEALQDRDRYECYRWAVRQTGIDPGLQPITAAAPQGVEPVRRDGSGAAVGAVTGAMAGAVMSSPRHAGPNMVLGAIFGGMFGAVAEESRAQAIERQQAVQQQQDWQARQVPLGNFRRAMSACMSGRGYTVR